MTTSSQQVIEDTRGWLERAVIGLNLCPFAKSVHVKGQIHYAVSQARSARELLPDLVFELQELLTQSPSARDTTLLIAPNCLADFLDFNDFLAEADQALLDLELDGIFQIASLHPRFQFAGTRVDDITNFTNRSPYPTLHLLREDSVDRAVEAFPEADAIFEKNMQTMERLGPAGWDALRVGRSQDCPVSLSDNQIPTAEGVGKKINEN
ncbi:MAG: DUF1415 domain-containing protein [Rhodoferax sp.]|uniref:DUF1415 domain-containing protein n=1 Tax=Rhodoferax sp. TaxID=50421 RepID=UPI00262C4D2D|nr:DUF1415 domain-containing protein [Rhodoferax sp.]MDD5333628.1 DUF1415 domain-containing protein [Rhodoferax sp.]